MHTEFSLKLPQIAEKDMGFCYHQFIRVTSVYYTGTVT